MPGNDYWIHIGLLFLLLFCIEYINGLIVKYQHVKVNYTRKINHFAIFFTPMLLMSFFPRCQPWRANARAGSPQKA